jgi:WS/DGAT/MGAT family acyltransferase
VNDVVLATVTEAVRRYLFRRRVDQRRVDFRIAAPVSVRRKDHDRRQGNHVSTWIVPLPIHLEDASEQLREIRATTAARKASEAALAIDTLMEAAEWLPAALVSRATRLAQGPANMIVTNVPGPQFPLYSVGARLLGMYPLVPLLPGGGLGVALFSYEDKLCWGFNADRELVPDLPMFVSDVLVAFEKLRAAAVSHYMNRRTGHEADAPEPSNERAPEKSTRKPAERKRTASKAAPAPAGSPGAVSATTH